MNEQIFQKLRQEAAPFILADLHPKDAAAVAAAFERLLRIVLDKDRSTIPNADAMALSIGENLIKKTSEVPPEKRLEYIEQELLSREISSLDWQARRLGEQSLGDAPDLPALRVQARVVLDKLGQIRSRLKEKGSEWERRYSRTLSEASLDCRFVLGEDRHSSLRLGRDIEVLHETGAWPPAWYAELWLKEDPKNE